MEFHGRNFERPLTDLINGEEEYEVEHIIDSRRFGRRRQVQYLVHWKGYPESEDQWIPWSDLNAPELVTEFQQENPDAVIHIRTSQSEETKTAPAIPPTSLPPTLHNLVYMSDGSVTLPMSTMQSRGSSLALYEAAAAEVSNDTDGSAIICCIMAIAVATATSGASEAGSGAEEGHGGDEGVFVDAHSGLDDDGTVLAGPNPHISIHHASSTAG